MHQVNSFRSGQITTQTSPQATHSRGRLSGYQSPMKQDCSMESAPAQQLLSCSCSQSLKSISLGVSPSQQCAKSNQPQLQQNSIYSPHEGVVYLEYPPNSSDCGGCAIEPFRTLTLGHSTKSRRCSSST